MAASAAAARTFRGDAGEVLPLFSPGKRDSVLLVGLGKAAKLDRDGLRRMSGVLARRMLKEGGEVQLPLDVPALRSVAARSGWTEVVEALAMGWMLGSYSFTTYKSDGAGKRRPASLTIVTGPLASARRGAPKEEGPPIEEGQLRRAASRAEVIARAANFARDLSNMPGNDLYPEKLAEHARAVARAGRLSCTVLGKRQLAREGMGALLGVSQGSDRPPCLIVLEYRPRGWKPRARDTAVLVGKAVTFDSGGLSIKPAARMEEMKFDMSGGAAVLGAMQAISALGAKRRVVGIIPATENVISGSAMRPGDILRSAAGKTIEVINTDAEGRLILADALHYARRYEPECVLDFATLTGACSVALGNQISGMVTNDRELGRTVFEAGERCGERVWELPLYDEFVEATRSQVADIKNSAGRSAGAITAAAFLSHFVAGLRWCHLDIAGTAWAEKESGLFATGATGVGVRLAVEVVGGA
jgi:leucyl aminopeptidase